MLNSKKRESMWVRNLLKTCVASTLVIFAVNAYASADTAESVLFAKVNDQEITSEEFDQIYAGAVRHKFYHGRVPESELLAFREQVARDVIEQMLLLKEAKTLGIEADKAYIDQSIEEYKQRYSDSSMGSEMWKQVEERLVTQAERRDILLKLEERIKQINEPTDEEVKAFYDANPDKFTEPSRDRVSMILLTVPPSAGGDAWQSAKTHAESLVMQLKNDADFGTLARENSGDMSAATGGELGYLHDGMLAPEAEQALKELEVGDVTQPIMLLEGVAIFKLNDRTKETKRAFKDVAERAKGLLYRTKKDEIWQGYKNRLKETAVIEVYEETLSKAVFNQQ